VLGYHQGIANNSMIKRITGLAGLQISHWRVHGRPPTWIAAPIIPTRLPRNITTNPTSGAEGMETLFRIYDASPFEIRAIKKWLKNKDHFWGVTDKVAVDVFPEMNIVYLSTVRHMFINPELQIDFIQFIEKMPKRIIHVIFEQTDNVIELIKQRIRGKNYNISNIIQLYTPVVGVAVATTSYRDRQLILSLQETDDVQLHVLLAFGKKVDAPN
jgi:hypothetical protein